MVGCPLSVDGFGEEEVLECAAVSKQANVSQLRGEVRHCVTGRHGNLLHTTHNSTVMLVHTDSYTTCVDMRYRGSVPSGAYLIQWLAVGPHYMLYYNIAMDEVGADPGRVEDSVPVLQEHKAHNIIANVPLLVHLGREGGRRGGGARGMQCQALGL